MILVDTSVWIEHLRHGDALLDDLLTREQVLVHPFVIGELSLGNLRDRDAYLGDLAALPQVVVADDTETMRLITGENLFGLGIGYVDAHLLASTRLTPEASLWTRDKRLEAVAERLALAARMTH